MQKVDLRAQLLIVCQSFVYAVYKIKFPRHQLVMFDITLTNEGLSTCQVYFIILLKEIFELFFFLVNVRRVVYGMF